jgi:hypothetical protein
MHKPLVATGHNEAGNVIVDGTETLTLAQLSKCMFTVPSYTLQARQKPLLR